MATEHSDDSIYYVPHSSHAPVVTAFGIFVIEKGEMKICYAEPGADRPKKFESKEGDKMFLLVLKRMKKE